MSYIKLSSLVLVLILFVFSGCSKKKEEAAKLEQEMMESLTDSSADSTLAVSESTQTIVAPQAVTPAKPKVPEMSKRPAGSGFTVQVASCEDETYARHLVDLYTSRGYEPFVSEFSLEGQKYYRVRIGIYETGSQAKALQKELSDRFSISTWIDFIEF